MGWAGQGSWEHGARVWGMVAVGMGMVAVRNGYVSGD